MTKELNPKGDFDVIYARAPLGTIQVLITFRDFELAHETIDKLVADGFDNRLDRQVEMKITKENIEA